MKGKAVRNIVIGTVTLLGIGCVIQKYVNAKRKKLEIKVNNEKNELERLDTNVERKYYPIGDVVSENGKYIVKKVS